MTETSESSAQRKFCSRRRIGRVSGPEVVLLGGSRGAASGHERVYVAQRDFFAAARSHHRTTWVCLWVGILWRTWNTRTLPAEAAWKVPLTIQN